MKSAISAILCVLCVSAFICRAVLPPQKTAPAVIVRLPVPRCFTNAWNPVPGVTLYQVDRSTDLVHWSVMQWTSNTSFVVPMTNVFLTYQLYETYTTNSDGSIATNVLSRTITNNAEFYHIRSMDTAFLFDRTDSNWPYSP